jgi:ABC-type Fe3+/spermidine/putrescine transport system ATPase subunit
MSDRPSLIDRTHRMLRGIGATVISELSGFDEIGVCQQLVVVEEGRITQRGIPSEIYARPQSLAAAAATGIFTEVPIEISGTEVSSPIGHWDAEDPPFSGSGIAIARPSAFAVAAPGEESDCLFAIEEAEFVDGRWRARGILSGASMLAIELPAESVVRKGKLLPLRYDPGSFVLLPREREAHPTAGAIPIDVIPPMRESR